MKWANPGWYNPVEVNIGHKAHTHGKKQVPKPEHLPKAFPILKDSKLASHHKLKTMTGSYEASFSLLMLLPVWSYDVQFGNPEVFQYLVGKTRPAPPSLWILLPSPPAVFISYSVSFMRMSLSLDYPTTPPVSTFWFLSKIPKMERNIKLTCFNFRTLLQQVLLWKTSVSFLSAAKSSSPTHSTCRHRLQFQFLRMVERCSRWLSPCCHLDENFSDWQQKELIKGLLSLFL